MPACLSPQGKPDLNTALPVRQTASIFKQPVTKITNHPSNKVKSDPQKAVEQPRQVNAHLNTRAQAQSGPALNPQFSPSVVHSFVYMYVCMYVCMYF